VRFTRARRVPSAIASGGERRSFWKGTHTCFGEGVQKVQSESARSNGGDVFWRLGVERTPGLHLVGALRLNVDQAAATPKTSANKPVRSRGGRIAEKNPAGYARIGLGEGIADVETVKRAHLRRNRRSSDKLAKDHRPKGRGAFRRKEKKIPDKWPCRHMYTWRTPQPAT